MKPEILNRLNLLQESFHSVVGHKFSYFFCPILFVDEDTELCKAHIVNEAFTGSTNRWTVQRKDVDGFFGGTFEGAFVDLKFNEAGLAYKALMQPKLYRRFRPKIIIDGVEVDHFMTNGTVPKEFVELQMELNQDCSRLGLKVHKSQISMDEIPDFQFEVSHDLRVPAVVSMLKAAHLTMFELFGYTYALGPGGVWLGQILGTFYLQNRGNKKKDVFNNASEYFGSISAMVRPVVSVPGAITGTIDDGWVHLCWPDDEKDQTPWGIIVYVRTGGALHSVLLPALEHERSVDRFSKFLSAKGDIFKVSITLFLGTHWAFQKERRIVHWPVATFK